MFCLTDVCKALGLEAKHVMERLDDGVVSTDIIIDRLGRTQQVTFVTESGLNDGVKPKYTDMKKIISAGKQPVKEFIAVLSDRRKILSAENQSTKESLSELSGVRNLTPSYLVRVAKAYAKNCMEEN